MLWNPDVYNQFKKIRYQPFFDLSDFISDENLKTAIDIGCGTGEQTKILAEKFPNTQFIGIEASAEMLKKSEEVKSGNLSFRQQTIESLYSTEEKWDLVFSNAALQWSDNHEKLFPKLISLVNDGGQFAVQMPVQPKNVLNKILVQQASEEPFSIQLKGFNRLSPVLGLDDYANMMFENGLQNLNISMKVYPLIAESEEELFNLSQVLRLFLIWKGFLANKRKILLMNLRRELEIIFQNFQSFIRLKEYFFTEENKRRTNRKFPTFTGISFFHHVLRIVMVKMYVLSTFRGKIF